MNINDAFPSNYLKASDLKGREVVVTIDRVEYEAVGRQKEMKAVIYFKGKEKGVVLNKTNANKIIELTGSAVTEEWDGFAVRLFPTTTEFGGETVECIRVKAAGRSGNGSQPPTRPKAVPPPPPVEDFSSTPDDDEIPF